MKTGSSPEAQGKQNINLILSLESEVLTPLTTVPASTPFHISWEASGSPPPCTLEAIVEL